MAHLDRARRREPTSTLVWPCWDSSHNRSILSVPDCSPTLTTCKRKPGTPQFHAQDMAIHAPPPTAWESLSTYSLQKSLLFLWFLVLLMFISGFLKLAIWHNFPWKVGKLFKKFFLSCVYGWICVYGWMFMSDSVGRVNVWPLHACFWLLLDAWVSKFCVSVIAIVANDWTQILCLTFPVLNLMKVILCCSALSKQLTILGMV